MARFPLFRLPHLVLKEIVMSLQVAEILQMSLCSNTTKRILTIHRNKRLAPPRIKIEMRKIPCSVRIFFENNHNFHLMLKKLPVEPRSQIYGAINYNKIYQGYFPSLLNSYWVDGCTGMRVVLDHLRAVFGNQVADVEIDAEHFPGIGEQVVDLMPGVPEHFKITYPLKSDLKILNSENLISLKCQWIELNFTGLNCKDLNEFLKFWVAGGQSNIKLVEVSMREVASITEVLEGVEAEERGANNQRMYSNRLKHQFVVAGGHDIRNTQGQVATIFVSRKYQDFQMYYQFRMIIWEYPRPQGNMLNMFNMINMF